MPNKYKGKVCKTPACGGHKAGAKYARSGGSTPSKYSSSFNEGMRAAKKTMKKKKRRGY